MNKPSNGSNGHYFFNNGNCVYFFTSNSKNMVFNYFEQKRKTFFDNNGLVYNKKVCLTRQKKSINYLRIEFYFVVGCPTSFINFICIKLVSFTFDLSICIVFQNIYTLTDYNFLCFFGDYKSLFYINIRFRL